MAETLSPRRLAAVRLAGLRRRIGTVRRRTVAFSVSVFTAAWIAVFAQMVSGHDPVLGSGPKPKPASRDTTHASSNRTPSSAGTGTRLVPVQTPQGVVLVEVPAGGSASAGSTQPPAQPSASPPAPVTSSTS
jgi:hypothetical protein